MELSTHKIFPKEICSKEYLSQFIIDNPAYLDALKMGFSTKGIPRNLYLYTEKNGMVYIPREANVFPDYVSIKDLRDKRVAGVSVPFSSKITLRGFQTFAVDALVKNETGILEAGCGTGKTVMALEAAARIGKTVLVLVHKGFLLEQWVSRITEFLGEEAGLVQADKWDWKGKKIVVAMLQTLFSQKDSIPTDFINYFGVVISDECHRISAPTWSQVISMFPGKRRYGLTATAKRADNLEVVFHAHLGKTLYVLEGRTLEPEIMVVNTDVMIPAKDYVNPRNGTGSMVKLINALTLVEERNRKILSYLLSAAKMGRKILLLTDRVQHAKFLQQSFNLSYGGFGFSSAVYLGESTKVERLEAEEADVIFATSQIAKEGLDIPTLDTLFLVSPLGSRVVLQQSIGRILRQYEGKKSPKVVDFVDRNGMCLALARKRMGVYDKLGYELKVIK